MHLSWRRLDFLPLYYDLGNSKHLMQEDNVFTCEVGALRLRKGHRIAKPSHEVTAVRAPRQTLVFVLIYISALHFKSLDDLHDIGNFGELATGTPLCGPWGIR